MRSLPFAITLAILGFAAPHLGAEWAAAAPEPAEIRSLEFDDYFDVDVEGALPFPPGAGTALILPTGDGRARLVPMGETGPEDADAVELLDSINASVDARTPHPRLVVFDRGVLTLRGVGSSQGSGSFDWGSLAIESPQGVAIHPESGSVFVLDAARRRIVRVDPGAGGNLDAATAMGGGRVVELPLPDGVESVRGLALDAARKRLYVLSPKAKALYELGLDGQLLDVRPVPGAGWRQPLGLAIAPSADRTDPAERTSLFLASATAGGAVVTEWSLEPRGIASAMASSERADLIRVIDTSRFSPPSPDPAGIAWDPSEDRLLVTDSEVNEMPIFTGDNFFETTRFGSLLRSRSTMDFSDEPTGIAIDRPGNRVFISDDTGTDRIYTVELGPDGRFDTSDDNVFSFDTKNYGSKDPEGVAFGNDTLYWVDGVNSEVYWMVAPDGDFDGRRDTVGHFDTMAVGVMDPEGIEWNPANGNLFIVGEPDDLVVEVTPTGVLVRNIDISEAKAKKPAGLAVAPRTEGSGWSLFVVDRRVDNDSNPLENDGRIYELAISGGVVAQCGNGVREAGEQCDGNDLGGASCSDQGCSSGTPSCTSSCTLSYASCSGCSECGNGIREVGEDCDGSDLGGGNCLNQGFYCGSGVSCRSDCRYDTSSCIAGSCGDDLVQAACGELCDGDALGGETCQSRGWGSGDLACQADCSELDESECSVCDNDGVCEEGENCGNCPGDCIGGGPACGNHVCEIDAGEDCGSCPSDCNGLQTKRKSKRYCCGDGAGDGPISCGDARCTAGGNTCEAAPVPSWCCGNGICEPEEDTQSCALDCGP